MLVSGTYAEFGGLPRRICGFMAVGTGPVPACPSGGALATNPWPVPNSEMYCPRTTGFVAALTEPSTTLIAATCPEPVPPIVNNPGDAELRATSAPPYTCPVDCRSTCKSTVPPVAKLMER